MENDKHINAEKTGITVFMVFMEFSMEFAVLFPLLEEIELVLTPKLQELVTALEMMKIERFLNYW